MTDTQHHATGLAERFVSIAAMFREGAITLQEMRETFHVALGASWEGLAALAATHKPASVDFLPHDDILRFAARVLDSEHPTAGDRKTAARELRQLRQSIRPVHQESAHKPVAPTDRDAAIRIWHKHCDKFAIAMASHPASCVVDAMLDFAALSAPVEAQAVPEGWKLVPIEPTNGMVEAALLAEVNPCVDFRDTWAAMLAAAPTKGEA